MKKIISILLLAIVCVSALSSCSDEEKMGTGACTYLNDRDTTNRSVQYVEICIEDYGRMVVLLDSTTAPKTVAHFVALVRIGFYDGKTFHRVEPELVLQGGCPNANGTGGIVTKLDGEFEKNGWENDIKHRKGVIAMARGEDYNSASCQFYICNDNSYELDGEYATFGYIVEGLSVIDDITADRVKYGDPSNYYIIKNKDDQPVIKYIKLLEKWSPEN